jgi:hypothetical protein
MLAIMFFVKRGELLWYGDATAHINIARRIIDNRTPGYEQIGTVWLPVPHLLMLPFVAVNDWWRTGLAGAFAGGICFVIAGCFLFATIRRLTDTAPALLAVAIFALNPNLLYLQSTAMSEAPLFAAMLALFWGLVYYGQTGKPLGLYVAAIAAGVTTMTRYEGWFLLPFAAVAVFLSQRRLAHFVIFCAIAGLAPCWWMFHNWVFFGDPLEFYRGQYSAKGIYQTALDKGMARYPGDGNWLQAVQYFFTAVRLNVNWAVVIIGAAGLIAAVVKRVWWLFFLALTPIFYIVSMHGSGTPIFIPILWPFSYYNARYGLAALPLAAAAAAALMYALPRRAQWPATFALAAAAVIPWLAYPRPDSWVSWKEAQVNSVDRRSWTRPAAEYLRQHYHRGDGILSGFGDQTGIFTAAAIPLKEVLHDGNGPAWFAATVRPDIFLHETWAIVREGDRVGEALAKLSTVKHPRYVLKESIRVKGAPAIEIWKRVAMPIPLPPAAMTQ